MADGKYFNTTKKGEIIEWKMDLNSDRKEKRKEAMKKVIANMTVGKDVGQLFADVVNCMQTDNLELKKLANLYVMNYAKIQPDTAILAVNTFAKDCQDPSNPLIRALAVRTMGCIRVEKITEHLCEPLRECLKDDDPYVRKTAAVCVAKMYDVNPTMVEEQGFLDGLRKLLSDSNPMVVGNSVAALTEISQVCGSPVYELNLQMVNKLLTVLNECTEWGQIIILDAIANFIPENRRMAESICERVTPRLAHANAAVVLSAVRALMRFMQMLDEQTEFYQKLTQKLAPPLVTLLSSDSEIQYVALRNINLIVQKKQDILKNEMKVFFVKYNDPIYVKLEKLDIMIRLTNNDNIGPVLSELKEYAREVDVDFVRKSVRAIGRCAIKVEESAQRCVSTLLELIQTKVNYVVQEAVVVIKDIFRKYPNQYESIIGTLCENLDTLDEPDARASMIWIIGEYAERIDNADELLETFLDGFHDENTQVQLQLLTAIVKLFLKKPQLTQDLVQCVLRMATLECDNPDLRDRGYIYWRLLSTDPNAAKQVVLAEKPLISEETDLLETSLLDELIWHIATLASVYHKPPSAFIEGKSTFKRVAPLSTLSTTQSKDQQKTTNRIINSGELDEKSVIPCRTEMTTNDLLDISNDIPTHPTATTPQIDVLEQNILGGMTSETLLDLDQPIAPTDSTNFNIMGQSKVQQNKPSVVNQSNPNDIGWDDLFSSIPTSNSLLTTVADIPDHQLEEWLTALNGNGLEIRGRMVRRSGKIIMEMKYTNKALITMNSFDFKTDSNSFGIAPIDTLRVADQLPASQSVVTSIEMVGNHQTKIMNPVNKLDVAVRNNIGTFYYSVKMPLEIFFIENGQVDKKDFTSLWHQLPNEKERQYELELNEHVRSLETLEEKLEKFNIHTVTTFHSEQQQLLFQSIKLTNGVIILCEVKFSTPTQLILSVKTNSVQITDFVRDTYQRLISQKS
ncbi:hypothetical protein SNEBB_002164 [Seison nebaliae]|nr:hypothetical protein SNEBB_002164 [Seison nebaliae]